MCSLLTERYADKIKGVLSCFDRIVVQGTLPNIGHAHGMTAYLHAHHIRIFDYAQFAEPFRDQIRENAERLAAENGLKIEFIRDHEQRKDELIRNIIRERGDREGLVALFSAMESCPTYKPWHDKETGENDDEDVKLFEIIARGEFNISGFQNKSLRQFLHDKTCEQVSRILKRLRMHGMIKRIRSTYKYYLTRLGRRILAAGMRLREFVLIPALASPLAAENA